MIRSNRAQRGFTLLEMLLAVAVIASIAMLGSSMWLQATESSAAAQGRERGLLLQRIGVLMRDQWADRRALDLPGEDERSAELGGARFGPNAISFDTTRSILLTDAPLVRAEYRIVSREDGSQDLIYIEQPVASFSGAGSNGESSGQPSGEAKRVATALLEGCRAIRMERFGVIPAEESDDERPSRMAWSSFETVESEDEELRSDAVRIEVHYQGEEALWVLVARALR
jgi:prepilin-type N-terminal cleavage/methylation domain-containing protein